METKYGIVCALCVAFVICFLAGMLVTQQSDIYKKGKLATSIPDFRLTSITDMQNDSIRCKTIVFDARSDSGMVGCWNETIYEIFNKTDVIQ